MIRTGNRFREIIGVIPAGGQATRISPLPCSKELYPIGYQAGPDGGMRPKAVSHYLLERMRIGGVEKVFFILKKGKWDIPEYFGNGEILGLKIAYAIRDLPYGVPFTLDSVYLFVRDGLVACGFPDILFQPRDAFHQLIERQSDTQADLVLGLFPTNFSSRWDMVELNQQGKMCDIFPKPHNKKLNTTWLIAVWTPVFSSFMHTLLKDREKEFKQGYRFDQQQKEMEMSLGEVVKAALKSDINTDHVLFQDGFCIDIGTPNDMLIAAQEHKRYE
jgi:glucose-1-phosphate thymidylyltransferase